MTYIFQFTIGRITEQHTRHFLSIDSAMSHALSMLSFYRVPSVEVRKPMEGENVPQLVGTVYAAAIQ